MESTGSDVKPKGGIISFQFELSRLSDGVKCATQGCKCPNFLIKNLKLLIDFFVHQNRAGLWNIFTKWNLCVVAQS